MSYRECYINNARDKANRASQTPSNTFMCRVCKQGRAIYGRRLVAGVWTCKLCMDAK